MSDTPPRLPGLPLQPGTAPRLQGPLLRAATLRLSWAQPRRFSWDDGSATPVSGRVPILRPRSRWLPLGLASLLLLGVGLGLLLIHQDRAGWPGLASRRGLYVAADEVWTGRREPIWIRTALPGPVLSAAPSRKHDRAAEVLALHTLAQRQGLDLSWVTWQSAAAPSSPGEWLRFKEQEEVIPQPALWVARSLAQQLVLPAPAPAAAARPRAARRGRRPRPAVTAGIPGTPRLLVFGSDLPLTGPLPAEGVFRLAHLLQGRVALLGPFPSLAEPSPLLSLRGYDGLAVFAGPDPAGPDPADPPTSGDAFYRWLVSFGGGAQRVAALAGSSGDAAAVDEAAPYTLALVSSADVDGLREAVDRRQTVAVRGIPDLTLTLPGLGQLQRTAQVSLDLTLGRKVGRIELWREQALIQEWTDVDRAAYRVKLTENAAFSFRIVDGEGVAQTSAVWYEPLHTPRPDLVVESGSLYWEDGTAYAVVRNRGDREARYAELLFYDRLPFLEGALPVGQAEVDRLRPGEALQVESFLDRPPPLLYVQAGWALGGDGYDPRELERGNNAAIRPLHGEQLLAWDAADRLRQRRAELRLAGGRPLSLLQSGR